MIAESNARRKKFGWEAMLMIMKFGQNYLKCEKFIAKIGFNNDKSQRMFERMHFNEISRSDVFQEITYERECTRDWLDWLDSNVEYSIGTYMNEQKAKEVTNYLVNSIKTTKTKAEVEDMLKEKLSEIKEIHTQYGPASEFLLAAYDVEHLARPAIASAYQEYLETEVAGDVLFLDE